LYDGGDRVAARATFERVLVLDEDNLVALKYLGMIEADEGHLDTAQRHLQQILSLDPENKEIKTILHLVEEQEQIERAGEAPSSGDEMDMIDEILGDAAPTPTEDTVSQYEPEPETAVESNSPASGGEAKLAGGDIETSDELASVTLADIFASQGYTAKAERIYREVLRKQPGNDVVRTRLRDLLGEEVVLDAETDAAVQEDTAPPVEDLSEVEDELKDESTLSAEAADSGVQPDASPVAAESVEERPVLAAARPAIDEKDNLGHFKRWLTKLQK
jgi:tetratricopeptide (TPR) repeat protein